MRKMKLMSAKIQLLISTKNISSKALREILTKKDF